MRLHKGGSGMAEGGNWCNDDDNIRLFSLLYCFFLFLSLEIFHGGRRTLVMC